MFDNSNNTIHKHRRSHKSAVVVLAIVVLAVGCLVGYKLYHNHQIAVDRARFTQAEEDVNNLSQAIVASAGQPAKTESKKYCSRPSQKFNNGPLSCHVEQTNFYVVDNADSANRLREKLEGQVTINLSPGSTMAHVDTTGIKPFVELDNNNNANLSHQQFIEKTSAPGSYMKCEIIYDYYPTSLLPSDNYLSISPSGNALAVQVDCGGSAFSQHYPITS